MGRRDVAGVESPRSAEPELSLPSDQDASGRSLGAEELERLTEVIRSGVLTSTKGTMVAELQRRLAQTFDVPQAIAASSGTAAIHAAIVALDPEPGDEIVTTAITDMGALAPILTQGAIPVFADVDPTTGNTTAATIAARISSRTRAVMVTHLFGTPCDMPAISALAQERGVALIEDCAQAFFARSQGQLVGTWGALSCFSTQQGKHITSGEGGFLLARDPALGRRARLAVDKAWPYGETGADHEFLALNGRMSELQGAVLLAQLDKAPAMVAQRLAMAQRLTEHLIGLEGVTPILPGDGDVATYWKFALRIDERVVPGGPVALAARLRLGGVASAPRYIQKPAFRCRVFAEQRTFGSSRWPFTLATPDALDYAAERFPGTFDFLEHVLVLPWNERYENEHVDDLAHAIHAAVTELCEQRA